MPVIQIGNNTLLGLKNKYGEIPNEQWVIISNTGFGKTIALEGIAEELHNNGYTVICIADPKNESELAFQMFEPEKQYHLQNLRLIGKAIGKQKVKLYHPYTNSIPREYLPNYNFFTIPIKDLGSHEWGLIVESAWESESVSLLLKSGNELRDSEGLYSFVHLAQNLIIGKTEGKKRKYDPRNFGLKTSSGSMKSVSEISRLLYSFKENYFLSSKDSKYNLDWKSIIQDQEHYHVFVTNFIDKDKYEKQIQFVVLHLMEAILRNKKYMTHPICILIPELRDLCPKNPEGYKKFLSEAVKTNLSMARSSGKGGMSFITDSTYWGDLDLKVRGTFSAVFLGRLTADDIDEISKKWVLNKETREFLKSPDRPNSFLWIQDQDIETRWTIWLPKAMHKEQDYSFIDMYMRHHRKNPEEYPIKNFTEMINEMKKNYNDEEKKFLDKERKKEIDEEKLEEKEKLEKEESKENKISEIKTEKKEAENKSKEIIMKLCYEMFNDQNLDRKEKTYRKIGEKLKIHHVSVKKYIYAYGKKINNQDFEEKALEEYR